MQDGFGDMAFTAYDTQPGAPASMQGLRLLPQPDLQSTDLLDLGALAGSTALPFLSPSDLDFNDTDDAGMEEDSGSPKRKRKTPQRAAARQKAGAAKPVSQRQQNNRKAQQRYRERQKAATTDLQAQVTELNSKLAEMEDLQTKMRDVQLENAELRNKLSDAANSSMLRPDGAARPSIMDAPASEVEQPTYEELQERMQAAQRELAHLLQQAGLSTSEYGGVEVQGPLHAQLAAVVERASALAQRRLFFAIRQKANRVITQGKEVLCEREMQDHAESWRVRWAAIVRALCLTAPQQETLMHARRTLLDKLPRIYDERATLAMAAMSTMLPRPSQVVCASGVAPPTGLLSSTDAKMQSALRFGLGCNQCKASDTVVAMEALHTNIVQEGTLLQQLNNLLLTEVLTTTQTAVLFVRSGCDPLEGMHFCNLLALQRGEAHLPPPPLATNVSESAALTSLCATGMSTDGRSSACGRDGSVEADAHGSGSGEANTVASMAMDVAQRSVA